MGEKLTDWKRTVGGRGVTAGVLYADAIFALMPRVPVWLETEGTPDSSRNVAGAVSEH